MRYQDIEEKLYQKALFLISRRPRSEKEVRIALSRSLKFSKIPKLSNQIITRLKNHRLLDDEEFTRWFVEQRNTFRPKGRSALMFELRQKGITEEVAEKVIAESVDEFSLVKELLDKKVKNPKTLKDPITRQKAIAFLSRRGFSWEVIKTALDDLLKKR